MGIIVSLSLAFGNFTRATWLLSNSSYDRQYRCWPGKNSKGQTDNESKTPVHCNLCKETDRFSQLSLLNVAAQIVVGQFSKWKIRESQKIFGHSFGYFAVKSQINVIESRIKDPAPPVHRNLCKETKRYSQLSPSSVAAQLVVGQILKWKIHESQLFFGKSGS